MCRSIKPLRLSDRQATEAEIAEAALQYVRKVSGYRKPSRVNQPAFEAAVQEVAAPPVRCWTASRARPTSLTRRRSGVASALPRFSLYSALP